ncbi:MAG: sulfatase [Sphingomonas sp.]|uniref:sulfatase family protein n=1 Tax=Sphingomonas sp. TaxID=28214 RepID=UPI001ACC8EA2|nr:sulfatase [Sphingomonas sp.]MBN8816217.1 sulfatase [Sphingomonas sp.]
MKRRHFLGAATGAALGLAPATRALSAGIDRAKRRNVLLIVSDDQGMDLGCLGVAVQTPNLDALAQQGTRFDQAYAAVSSCSSSRAVVYTGLYTHQNGMYGLAHDAHNQGLRDGIETLPYWLKKAGYATALVGKKHVKPEGAFPYDAELAPERAGIRDVALLSDAVELFLRGIGDAPFFVTVGFSDPHRAPVNFGNNQPWPRVKDVRYDPAKVTVPSHLPDLPAVRGDLAQYYESLSRLDDGVGMIRAAIERCGRADDTLIVFLSDNGRPFPGAKTNLYDPGLHLPLIVHAPGLRGGATSDAMVSWIDIAPTILEWTGAAGPAYPLPGRSVLPLLGERGKPGWDMVFASHEFHEIDQYYPMRAIRTRTRSYIENLAWQLPYPIAGDVAGSDSWKAIAADPRTRIGKRTQAAYRNRPAREFYDLERDPDEVVNLGSGRARAAERDALAAKLTAFRKATGDPWTEGLAATGKAEG